jgi:hypothetical protein
MKNTVVIFLAGILLFVSNSCNYKQKRVEQTQNYDNNNVSNRVADIIDKTQKDTNNKQINTLKEFYSSYAKIWSADSLLSPEVFNRQCDSLFSKYCTNSIKKKANEWLTDGFNLLTDDWWIDIESLKTMEIMQDSTNSNTFIISYITNMFPVSPTKPVKYKITLSVNVIKEGDEYKINGVTGNGLPIE